MRIVVSAALVLALAPLAWSARHLNTTGAPTSDEPMQHRRSASDPQDSALNQPTEQDSSDAPLPPLPQYARSTVQVGSHVPAAPLPSAEDWQPADAAREPLPLLDEGPDIAAQRRLQPLANIGNREGARNVAPWAAGWQGSGTITLSGDNGGMPTDSGSQVTDPGRPRVDGSQLPASAQSTGSGPAGTGAPGTGSGQGAGGAQNGGASSTSTNGPEQAAPNSNGGGQAAGNAGGGQAADATTPPGNDTQQAGTGTHIPEVIDIQAGDMQWDPAHAHMHQGDGELFMFSNSSADAQFDLNTPGQGLSIFARADKAGGQWPTVTVSIDGTEIGTITVNSAVEKKFYLPISVDPGQVNLQLSYTNDFYDPNAHQDRNLYISHIKVVAQGTTQGQ